MRVKHGSKAMAHMLADIIAWLNSHKTELDGITVLDMTRRIGTKLVKGLVK